MLTVQKNHNTAIVSTLETRKDVDELLTKEWLLTNERGSYASSTIVGCNTRAYHGLLIGSLNPPANRIMALANCLEMVILGQKIFNLSTFEFSDKFAPQGYIYIKQFRQDRGVHFYYQLNNLTLVKSVYLARDTDAVALVYDFSAVQDLAEFVLRPFIGLRNFHTLQKSYAPLYATCFGPALVVRHDTPNSCELFLSCPSENFEKDPQWWFNFVYRYDRARGQQFTEDLWTPGFFKCPLNPHSPTRLVLWAKLSPPGTHNKPKQFINTDLDALCENLLRHQNKVLHAAKKHPDERFKILCLAADQFITERHTNRHPRTTILAGYPWYADWGRDAFIALPGLLLSMKRFEEANSVLTTFAQSADEGMIPNRFDDYSHTAYFNSVDASLWFINAAFQYLNATGDLKTFTRELLPVIRSVIESYYKGTRFGIRADTDGLITSGNYDTQLTWMDAKCDGIAFTPRCGKAVEVNALWYNSLCYLAKFYTNTDINTANQFQSLADKAAGSFRQLFWNPDKGYLNDCILPDGSTDDTLRPNQIFAVSLPFTALSAQQQMSVVNILQRELLTPFGLRTLNVQDRRYKGKYIGPQKQRDEAYHQGTVWPYLIGPFVEAYLKVNEFSPKCKKKATEFIQPLLQHLTEDGCLGQICEIFDGDAPHKPRGCFAQAWSVGELIRAYQMING